MTQPSEARRRSFSDCIPFLIIAVAALSFGIGIGYQAGRERTENDRTYSINQRIKLITRELAVERRERRVEQREAELQRRDNEND